jgi:hypothetical protein
LSFLGAEDDDKVGGAVDGGEPAGSVETLEEGRVLEDDRLAFTVAVDVLKFVERGGGTTDGGGAPVQGTGLLCQEPTGTVFTEEGDMVALSETQCMKPCRGLANDIP